MGGMKNALLNIYQCGLCASQGWISFDSGDGEPDYEPCACNPYEFPREELEDTFAEWQLDEMVWQKVTNKTRNIIGNSSVIDNTDLEKRKYKNE